MADYEPCPTRIIIGIGHGFSIGLIGGSILDCVKGFRSTSIGFRNRLLSSLLNVKRHSPITAGNFAMWCGFCYTTECILDHLRGKEDPWNRIAGCSIGSAIMFARYGPGLMVAASVFGGILASISEGVNIYRDRQNDWEYGNRQRESYNLAIKNHKKSLGWVCSE